MLMNVGPMADGAIRPVEAAMLDIMGQWVNIFQEAIYEAGPSGIPAENEECDVILKNGDIYYLFCSDLPMAANPNVALVQGANYTDGFSIEKEIADITWLDNGKPVAFE